MLIERAREYLKKYGLDKDIMEFDVSSATVELAANAIGCTGAEIAKTLSFRVEDEAILIVAAGDARIDNAKFKAEFHTKAKMLTFDEVEDAIGHAVGGVCPFGVNEGVKIYLDCSLKRFDSVYPACGSSNSAIKLTLEKLMQIVDFVRWVDVAKDIQ